MSQDLFFATARERFEMLQRRLSEAPLGIRQRHGERLRWTDDEILASFRFCNVFRHHDAVTEWFINNIQKELGNHHSAQVRAAVVFRWFNNVATGEALKPYLLNRKRWLAGDAKLAVQAMADRGERILNPAYMIKSPPGVNKTTGLFECIRLVLDDLDVLTTRLLEGKSLQLAHTLLQEFPYLGPFMAYQMVCDLRFTPVLEKATDINTWTAPGPGSARGIGRMFHDDPKAYNYNSERDQELLRDKMRYLLECSRERAFWPAEWPKWELSTVQHWCCEYDKYMREKLGEGHPKQKYRPAF